MQSLKDRLERIERAIGERPARIIVVGVPFEPTMADGDLAAFLVSQGIAAPADDDLVVKLLSWTRTVPRLVSVSEKRP